MADANTSTPTPAAVTGRGLAAHALLAGARCTQRRVGVLLETSRRSIGRLIAADVATAVHDAEALTAARAYLARADVTIDERQGAEAWLLHAERDEQPAEPAGGARRRPTSSPAPRARNGPGRTATQRRLLKAAPRVVPPSGGLTLEQVEALTRQQQRIERRSLVLNCVLGTLGADPVREALADLLSDITEAARTIGTLLQRLTECGKTKRSATG